MRTISARLPDAIHRKVKELAARDGSSVHQFLATAAAEKRSCLARKALSNNRAGYIALPRQPSTGIM
jgi:hypothetical protein